MHSLTLTEEEYDRPLHIGAIFILMGVSLLGTATPWLLTRMGYSHKVIIADIALLSRL